MDVNVNLATSEEFCEVGPHAQAVQELLLVVNAIQSIDLQMTVPAFDVFRLEGDHRVALDKSFQVFDVFGVHVRLLVCLQPPVSHASATEYVRPARNFVFRDGIIIGCKVPEWRPIR